MFWSNACVALVTAALATTASAVNRTGPFHLAINGHGKDSVVNGYAKTCSGGAAVQGLCYSAGQAPVPSDENYEFYYTYNTYDVTTGTPMQPGYLSWVQKIVDSQLIELTMRVKPPLSTNVGPALFETSMTQSNPLNFDPTTGDLYAIGFDDSHATADSSKLPQANYTKFFLCYQYIGQETGGYWYHSIAWVFGDLPRNPTCETVSLSIAKF